MDKKELKWYVTPDVEIIETELEGFLCASNIDDIDPNNDEEL
jgi:hypothetical protein